MFDEIRKNLTGLKEKIKGIDKKVALKEYLSLIKRKIELEAELNKKKSAYYAELAKIQDRKARKKTEHFKFVCGGIVLKLYPEFEKLQGQNELIEKIFIESNLKEKVIGLLQDYLDYLKIKEEIENIVELLTGNSSAEKTKNIFENIDGLEMPERAKDKATIRRALNYLAVSGIDLWECEDLAEKGQIYIDNHGNAVFVCRSADGEITGAEVIDLSAKAGGFPEKNNE